jgi:FemAB-related protein (PEP-CTERM system-associated)
VLMITHEGRDVAAVMSFYFRQEVIPYYGGSTSAARNLKGVNHFMYWELMRHSCAQGYRLFDFGRSKAGTGPFSFKKNFGFEPQPLPYEYYLVTRDTMPDVNPLNPKYRLMINVWTRLPLPVANTVGPLLARSLG